MKNYRQNRGRERYGANCRHRAGKYVELGRKLRKRTETTRPQERGRVRERYENNKHQREIARVLRVKCTINSKNYFYFCFGCAKPWWFKKANKSMLVYYAIISLRQCMIRKPLHCIQKWARNRFGSWFSWRRPATACGSDVDIFHKLAIRNTHPTKH